LHLTLLPTVMPRGSGATRGNFNKFELFDSPESNGSERRQRNYGDFDNRNDRYGSETRDNSHGDRYSSARHSTMFDDDLDTFDDDVSAIDAHSIRRRASPSNSPSHRFQRYGWDAKGFSESSEDDSYSSDFEDDRQRSEPEARRVNTNFQFYKPEQFSKFKSDNFIHRMKRLQNGEHTAVASLKFKESKTQVRQAEGPPKQKVHQLSPRVRQASKSSTNRNLANAWSSGSQKSNSYAQRGAQRKTQAAAATSTRSARSSRSSGNSSIMSSISVARSAGARPTKLYTNDVPPQISKFNVKLSDDAGTPVVNLSWTVPHHRGHPVSLFEVQQQVASEGIWTTLVCIRTRPSPDVKEHKRVHRFTVTDLRDGVRLKYRVRAENKWGWGPYSAASKAVMAPRRATRKSRSDNASKASSTRRAAPPPALSSTMGARKLKKKITTTTTTVTVETGDISEDEDIFADVPVAAPSPKVPTNGEERDAGIGMSDSVHINNLEASLMRLDLRLRNMKQKKK